MGETLLRPTKTWHVAACLKNMFKMTFCKSSSLFHHKRLSGWIAALPLVQLKPCNRVIMKSFSGHSSKWFGFTTQAANILQGSHICRAPCSSVKRYAHSCPGSKQFRRFQRTIQIGLNGEIPHWSLTHRGFEKGAVMMGSTSTPFRSTTREGSSKTLSLSRDSGKLPPAPNVYTFGHDLLASCWQDWVPTKEVHRLCFECALPLSCKKWIG